MHSSKVLSFQELISMFYDIYIYDMILQFKVLLRLTNKTDIFKLFVFTI